MELILLKFTSEVLLANPMGELVIKEAPSVVKALVILSSNPIELVTKVVVPGTKLISNDDNYKNKLQVIIQKEFKLTPDYVEIKTQDEIIDISEKTYTDLSIKLNDLCFFANKI